MEGEEHKLLDPTCGSDYSLHNFFVSIFQPTKSDIYSVGFLTCTTA